MATPAGGGAKATPSWVETLLGLAFAVFVIVVSIILLSKWALGENKTVETRVVYPQGNTVIHTNPPAAASRSRVPTPEEVYRTAPRRTERVPVDCITTHSRAADSNRCSSIRWVPGND